MQGVILAEKMAATGASALLCHPYSGSFETFCWLPIRPKICPIYASDVLARSDGVAADLPQLVDEHAKVPHKLGTPETVPGGDDP